MDQTTKEVQYNVFLETNILLMEFLLKDSNSSYSRFLINIINMN